MDLGFAFLDRSRRRIVRAAELGVLIADAAARQAASPTARVQARLRPVVAGRGSFDPLVAAILDRPPLMTAAFTEPL